MGDPEKREIKIQRAATLLSRLLVSVLGILLLIALIIRIYLATPYPSDQLSRFITSHLQQSFSVKTLETSGATLILKGVRLKNPAGFPEGNLVAADSVAIAPQWGNLLRGGQRFRLIALEGIQINLAKNAKGIWNFSQLQQILAARKKPAAETAETHVNELIVKDGSFKVQGQGVQGISLKVFNLTTKGSLDSKVDLAFEDAAHNRYALKGKARAGTDAALDLTLTAPTLSLKDVALLLKLKNPGLFEGGKGALNVNATLLKGELATKGDFWFSQMRLPAAGRGYPLKGALHFAADYSTQSDTAQLQSATLTVDKLVKLHAEGGVKSLKDERAFHLIIGMDEVDLAMVNVLVPEESRKKMLVGGKLRCDSLQLSGDGKKGLKSATGTLQLRDATLAKEGELLVAGLSGTIGVSRQNTGIVAKGRLSTSGRHQKALLDELDMPLNLTVSPQLKPIRAEVPALSATVTGIPIRGRLAFDAAKENPIAASLKVPAARLSDLNPLLKRYDLNAASGTASATLEVSGKGAQDFSGTANLQLSEVRGSRGKDAVAVKKGSIAAKVQRRAGRLLAQGDVDFSGMAFNGKGGDARFGYKVADGMVVLDGTHLSFAGARVAISRLMGRIPARRSAARVASYPISLDMDGLSIKRRDMEIGNLSGRLRGSFNTDSSGRWLEGTADLGSKAVNWQGKALAAPVVHAVFARPGGRAELSGEVLGGKLAGSASFNPFAPEAGGAFDVAVSGAKLASAGSLIPKGAGVYPSAGLIDLRLKGGYSRRDGLACRFDSKGSGIALTGGGGKTLLSGAGLSLAGELAGGTLTISDAVLSPGQGVALKLKGELTRALSPKREGSISFALPETSINGMVDPFVNILPRLIQEATVDGTMAADGKIDLHQGGKLVQGGVSFKDGRIEVASQKLLVADINGRVPFSLDLSGKGGGKPHNSMAFSKENYPRLLEQMRKSAAGGQVVSAGKIAFGALELGRLTMHVNAGNGITAIDSLTTSLYEGALLGRGFVTIQEKLNYRGDLLVNGLSLKALCQALAVQGYISGRVDGVISLSGAGSGLAGIAGFTELWAREGSGEKMEVSKEFLQRLAKQKLSGFFLSADRPYDQAEIKAMLEQGDLTFDSLKILNTNLFGVRDLNVSIAPGQNRIALDHLLESIKEAAVRGKPAPGDQPGKPPVTQEFKWGE
ncbi:MAG: AsmA family protein [Geobacteraceae bacterium GWC2_58_44]|nr:MAG: AsmA family protein [Geobacteraceae bacterium GWC2_58_44]HBG04934.1 AsmA family protein [Geobacter sp.]